MKWRSLFLVILSLGFLRFVFAEHLVELEENKQDLQDAFRFEIKEKNFVINLKNPTYRNGILMAEQGGTISTPQMLIQAQKICYIHKQEEGKEVHSITAEGDLMLFYHEQIMRGDRLEYDFITKTGTLFEGTADFDPWYAYGHEVYLLSDGNFKIDKGFITTCSDDQTGWKIKGSDITLEDHRFLVARNIRVTLSYIPVFWLPYYRVDLKKKGETPIKYHLRWSSVNHGLIGMSYRIIDYNDFKTYLRLDYRTQHGFGGGVITRYSSPQKKLRFNTLNYITKDSTSVDPKLRNRYRFQGDLNYSNLDKSLIIDGVYDRISDPDMPTDYNDMRFNFKHPTATKINIGYRQPNWRADLIAHPRINPFEATEQQLPNFKVSHKAIPLFGLPFYSVNSLEVGYWDYVFSKDLSNPDNYHSARYKISNKLFVPIHLGSINLRGNASFIGIQYENTPSKRSIWAGVINTGILANTSIYRKYSSCLHEVKPYIDVNYTAKPTRDPGDYYVFDVSDIYTELGMMRFGVRQFWYKDYQKEFEPWIDVDIYARAFFATDKINPSIPRLNGDISWSVTPNLKWYLNSSYHLQFHQPESLSTGVAWAAHQDFSVRAEYRQTKNYHWKKADHNNFYLDAFRSFDQLLDSSLVNRKKIILTKWFYRFHPDWVLKLQTRTGWKTWENNNFNEFRVELVTLLRCQWRITLFFEHLEKEDRYGLNINLISWNSGLKKYSRL